MDKWLTVTKPTSRRANDTKSNRSSRYTPYASKPRANCDLDVSESSRNESQVDRTSQLSSATALNKLLFTTLGDETNPITHSDIYERSEHMVSIASGHQRSERRSGVRTDYIEDRKKKLKEQHDELPPDVSVLSNVRVYINGYLSDTTDIEMKRIVTQAGGQVVNTASTATHIVTSHSSLNASATHKFLHTKSKHKRFIVKPEWVTESIARCRKQPERVYAVIKDTTTMTLRF